jgi:hypothetical protein
MLPRELVTHITAICGSKGDEWFDRLARAFRELENRWSVKVHERFSGIEYNIVAPATTNDGSLVVVKIAPPFVTTEIGRTSKIFLNCTTLRSPCGTFGTYNLRNVNG